ncbi:AraC family transcriptional regulator [Rhodoferax fermentans]|uniref:AraC family transcriptional regulator n=1 Tax=Rhodoferax fermentans TaxID=28066 RepID=A0A1T1ASV9_RHOFE|nr:AraC family transcriptional regulator [Rhodoferax fermentans]MBK1682366.1 AraC family transcriptional regulator [Rhodoferax fermentans]OOV07194.1 AraC family transcriptional regulator [Rhodoferax fermentans]
MAPSPATTSPASAEFWRDPALPYAESRRACHSRACYKAHSHPSFSVGAVDQGSSRFTSAGTGPSVIQPGTVVWVPAAHVHACNPLPNTAWSYQMLHLEASWLQALWQESSVPPLQTVQLTQDAGIYARFCQLNAVLFSDASTPEKEIALIAFLGDCASQGQPALSPSLAPDSRHKLQPLLAHLQHEADALISLTELAKMANMSRYQLIRAFRQATGLTPHAYQLNQRINQARHHLRAGEPLADIAYRLGFADQGHFQRVFKAHVGVTPGRYRA